MKVLIVGGGGREHALAWKAAQSALVEQVYVAPGNAGTGGEARVANVAIDSGDIPALAGFAEAHKIGLTIIGPEAPLVAGVADVFRERGLACFGPGRAAARLEGSKTFAKEFLHRHAIPTAAWGSFNDLGAALAYLNSAACPVVIKADGLAAGKGVVIAETRAAAHGAITDMLTDRRCGDAARRVVVEEFLEGEEVSFICMVDGETILPLASSQDHKAAGDGDTGPNTGGMGACSPAPVVDDALHARILETVIRPTVRGMAAEGMPYTGFLYAGLMIGVDGVPKVLEFNCRLGDPETQPILMRLRSDLVAHCLAAVRGGDGGLGGVGGLGGGGGVGGLGGLSAERAQWDRRCALGVVMAAEGYPGGYVTGSPIDGPLHNPHPADAPHKVFHAGTQTADGQIVTAGGRVLCATALGDSVRAAGEAAYRLARRIRWAGCWYRSDIGHRAIAREGQ